jgi:hypothetical protein
MDNDYDELLVTLYNELELERKKRAFVTTAYNELLDRFKALVDLRE